MVLARAGLTLTVAISYLTILMICRRQKQREMQCLTITRKLYKPGRASSPWNLQIDVLQQITS